MKKRILIVDDEVNFGQLLKLNLEACHDDSMEYEALVATNGAEGIEMVRRYHPDLVLLDIMMPDMNGLEGLKQIKAIAPQTPVAMVTAVWKDEEGRNAFAAGAYDYIIKPVDFEYLKTALLVKLFG